MIEFVAWMIQPINWPDDPVHPHVRRQPPEGALTNHDGHPVFSSGQTRATPGCPCRYCREVFEEWTAQARGFQQFMNELGPAERERYFGPNGVAAVHYV